MIKKLLPLLVLSTISATTVAATPPNTLVVAQGLDDIVSLDPAEANELSSIQTVPSLYQRVVQPTVMIRRKSLRFWRKVGRLTPQPKR